MKRLIRTLLVLCLPLLLTNCFEVTEAINMKADGSGDLLVTIDMSASKDNLKAYLQMDKVQGMEVPSVTEMKKEVETVRQTISKIKGMSNVKTSTDFDEFVFTLSGDFDRVKTLNKAINAVADELNRTPLPTLKKDNFKFKDNEFRRLFRYGPDLKLSKEEFEELNFSARYVMETAKYVSVYRFQQPIKRVSNNKAQVSPSKKAVKLENSIAELIRGESSIENTIEF